jgi:hypothetical protein
MSIFDWSMTRGYIPLHAVYGWYVRCYTYQTQIILRRCASQTETEGRNSWEKIKNKYKIKYRKKNNNAANYIERFTIPTVLLVKFTVCATFVDSRYMKLCFDVITDLYLHRNVFYAIFLPPFFALYVYLYVYFSYVCSKMYFIVPIAQNVHLNNLILSTSSLIEYDTKVNWQMKVKLFKL